MPESQLETLISPEQLQHLSEVYENARMDGLCHTGAWEIASATITNLHLSSAVLTQLELYLQD